MNLLMVSGNDRLATGLRSGNFYNNLLRFSHSFERVDVVCPFVSDASAATIGDSIFLHVLKRGLLFQFFFAYKEIMRLCSQHKPKLIVAHAYGLQFMLFGAWLASKKTGVPLAVEVHHIEGYPRAATFKDWLMKVITFTLLRLIKNDIKIFRVVNKAEALPLLLSLGIPEEKIKILYSMYLDRSIFYPAVKEPKEFDLIFVGRLIANKGLWLFLDAFDIAKKKMPLIKLAIVGDGPLKERLVSLIGSRLDIYFTGILAPEEVADMYRRSRAVICTSFAEGGPLFVVEGMACGLPAISTPVGLMKEIIENGKNGFLVESWDAAKIAEVIVKILSDDELRRNCSLAAVATAARFDYEKIINDYVGTYKDLAVGL